MSSHRIDELLHKLQQLQGEVEAEVETLLTEKQAEFRYKGLRNNNFPDLGR